MKLIKKNNSSLKFETILFFTAEFDQKFFCKHLNRIVIFISTLAFQKYFLFKILKLFQYIFSHLNLIPNFFSNTWLWLLFFTVLAFQKYFLFKILKLFQYIFSHLNLIPNFFSNTWKTQSLASFSPQGIFFKFYYLECFRKFKILNFFQLFCSISWSWFKKKFKPWN